jgi:hypothetical protein
MTGHEIQTLNPLQLPLHLPESTCQISKMHKDLLLSLFRIQSERPDHSVNLAKSMTVLKGLACGRWQPQDIILVDQIKIKING